jgi:hypothetical protein
MCPGTFYAPSQIGMLVPNLQDAQDIRQVRNLVANFCQSTITVFVELTLILSNLINSSNAIYIPARNITYNKLLDVNN